MKNRISSIILAALLCFVFLFVGACSNDKPESFSMVVFTDVHHGDMNYNNFDCTNGLKKLRTILDETRAADCFVNLGDLVDYLKGGKSTFYDEAVAVFNEFGLSCYTSNNSADQKLIYNAMGNHEAAYIAKKELSAYVPYVDNIGSCYVFERGGVLFVMVDANFERESASDDTSVLRTATKFTIPEAEINWLKNAVSEAMHEGISSIVWLSHIAFKDIDNTSRFALADELISYGLPVTIFDGHTHVEADDEWINEDTGKLEMKTYTLPAVTTGLGKAMQPGDQSGYRYYILNFEDGKLKTVTKRLDGLIYLE